MEAKPSFMRVYVRAIAAAGPSLPGPALAGCICTADPRTGGRTANLSIRRVERTVVVCYVQYMAAPRTG